MPWEGVWGIYYILQMPLQKPFWEKFAMLFELLWIFIVYINKIPLKMLLCCCQFYTFSCILKFIIHWYSYYVQFCFYLFCTPLWAISISITYKNFIPSKIWTLVAAVHFFSNCVFSPGQICPPPLDAIKLDFRQSQETVFIALRTRGKDNRSNNRS